MTKSKKPKAKAKKKADKKTAKISGANQVEDDLDKFIERLQNACNLYYAAVTLAIICLDVFDDALDRSKAIDALIEAHAEYKNYFGKTSVLQDLHKKNLSSDRLLEVCDVIINETMKSSLPPLRWVNWRMFPDTPFLYVSDMNIALNFTTLGGKHPRKWNDLAFHLVHAQVEAWSRLIEYARRGEDGVRIQIAGAHERHSIFRASPRGLSGHTLFEELSPIERLEVFAHDYWQTCDEFAHLQFDFINTGKWTPPKDVQYTASLPLTTPTEPLMDYEVKHLEEEVGKTSLIPFDSPFDTLQGHRDLSFFCLQNEMISSSDLFFGAGVEPCTDDFLLPYPHECADIDEWHKKSEGPIVALQRRINIAKNREAIGASTAQEGTDVAPTARGITLSMPDGSTRVVTAEELDLENMPDRPARDLNLIHYWAQEIIDLLARSEKEDFQGLFLNEIGDELSRENFSEHVQIKRYVRVLKRLNIVSFHSTYGQYLTGASPSDRQLKPKKISRRRLV